MEGDTRRRESSGEQLRDDGFFDARGALRLDAEELLEGVLRRSASTYEERKLPLLARLYSTVAHDKTISPSEGRGAHTSVTSLELALLWSFVAALRPAGSLRGAWDGGPFWRW
jgi:hypothetical protein